MFRKDRDVAFSVALAMLLALCALSLVRDTHFNRGGISRAAWTTAAVDGR